MKTPAVAVRAFEQGAFRLRALGGCFCSDKKKPRHTGLTSQSERRENRRRSHCAAAPRSQESIDRRWGAGLQGDEARHLGMNTPARAEWRRGGETTSFAQILQVLMLPPSPGPLTEPAASPCAQLPPRCSWRSRDRSRRPLSQNLRWLPQS